MQTTRHSDNLLKRAQSIVLKHLFLLMIPIMAGTGLAQAGQTSQEVVNALPNGVAMDGFDVVAYFTTEAPKRGDEAHSVEYKGKTWLFSSADNASKFSANPEQYAPQHNGWCSYAVSEGYGAEVDFVNGWAIIDGKLYLNWDEDTRDAFVAKQTELIPEAREKWDTVHQGLQDGSLDVYTHAEYGVDISHPQKLKGTSKNAPKNAPKNALSPR